MKITSPKDWLSPKDPHEARLQLELLQRVMRLWRLALFAMPLISATLAGTALVWIPVKVIAPWFVATLIGIAASYASASEFLRAKIEPHELGVWTLRVAAGLTPYLIAFAAMIPLVWVQGNTDNNIHLTVTMLVGLPIAALLFGPCPPLAFLHIAFYVPILLLYSSFGLSGHPWLGPAVYLVYIAVNCGLVLAVNRYARRSVSLQLRNEELVSELSTARERAERANETKSVFLASMSHELRTPLNAIMGFSELIQRGAYGPLAPKYLEYAATIHAGGAHLLNLINDILDLAKIEAGKRELTDKEVDIATLAQESLRFVERQAAEAGVSLKADIEPNVTLIADERSIMQIIANLLSNAVKFTPRGGRTTVFAKLQNGTFILGVKDTGEGMTPEQLKKALEPYGQTSLDRVTVEGRGTGLGLAIVQALVEAHGARFNIESEPGRGTKAWAEFPPARVRVMKAAA
jgi:two-component system cell cycle sensor histidine kinase PleC